MIELRHISKQFGRYSALEDVTARIGDESIYGLIGYNGAGKTTLLNMISGLYLPSGGEIVMDVDGEMMNPFDNVKVKRNLFYVSDDPYFMSSANLLDMRDFYKGFYRNFSDSTFEKLVKICKLDPEKRIGDFSKGMKRQAAILLGMSSRVRYLLLDESFDGLDPNMRVLVSNLLTEYLLEVGATIVVASHNLYELENICDTIGMINGKRMIFSKDIEDVRAKVKKYRVALDKKASEEVFAPLHVKNLKGEGNIYTFVCGEEERAIRERLSEEHEILLFEAYPLALNEIFKAEMGGGEDNYEGIFE